MPRGDGFLLAFIDVSGDPYAKPKNSPWIAVYILCIRKRSIYDITAMLHRLKKNILANEYIEMKSTELINQSTLNHPDLNKAKFLQAVMEQCIDHADCRHAAVVFKNSGQNQKNDNGRLPKHYIDALWRIESIARDWRASDVLTIIDNDRRKTDRNLAFAFNDYIYRSSGGNQLEKILPVPLFADSETTAGLQLADIGAGIMRNYYARSLYLEGTNADTIFLKKLNEYHGMIKKRSINKRVGSFHVAGIFSPPASYNV